MNDLEDVVREFLVESYENLDQLERDLVVLERAPQSADQLSSIFRTIHTIKGTCGFLGFTKLESVTHVGENLLSKLREGQLLLQPQITTGLLALVDAVRSILGQIETAGHEGDTEYAELIGTLVELQDLNQAATAVLASQAATEGNAVAAEARPTVAPQAADAQAAAPQPAQPEASAEEHAAGGISDSTIRVDVGLLDKLMNRVGELVLARNQVLQFTSSLGDASFLSTSQRLNLITTELQEGVMKTRMQPIGLIWSKFPRVVRDLALLCGKQVRVEMEGKETELDKTIVEAIKDPLTHLVRNSVDHGIETPEVRLQRGKPVEGRLLLRAFHEGGQVNIEIIDDGGGLDLDRIRQKAIERGILSPDQAQRLTDREVAQLIFSPGFSTAAQVSNISGRGVGMDVVKTNVEKIGGTVDIQTQAGQGTTISLKIPLTLAIIPALIVSCHGNRYAIPQVSLLELVRLEGEQARRGIEWLHGAPVYRLRGKLLPIVYLRRELELDREPVSRHAPGADTELMNIVVLRADDRQFGLVVDAINDTEEIVVKPLGKQLKGIPVFAGATIMGDGKVALILDVPGTAQRARVVSEVRDHALADTGSKRAEQQDRLQTLLILAVGSRRLALPTSMVARLEEIPRHTIELADGREVVQYREQILPLVRLGEVLQISDAECDGETLQVVVYTHERTSVGLIVDRIADIVDSAVELRNRPQGGDLLGSVVIQDRVTDLLNLPAIIRRAEASLFTEGAVL